MSVKTIAGMAGALAVLVLAVPASAQSMFEQMPSADGPGAAAAPSPAPTQSMMGAVPAPTPQVAIPAAKSVAPQAGVDCNGIQKTLEERKALIARANTASTAKQKMTPAQACALFNQLQTNGAAGVKWITANKEWCSIPDSFSEGFKADHVKVGGIRSKVCGMAAQVTKMEAQAREGGGGGGGLLGGPGLSGSFKLPQGAL